MSGESVLVAEDNCLLALEVDEWLKAEGFSVVGPAATLEKAQALAQAPLDLAVIDLNLGGRRADALVSELAARNVKVIVLSGYRLIAVEKNVVAVLDKPCSREVLLSAVARASEALSSEDGGASRGGRSDAEPDE
jgi:CheY-like chemotaxis protein